MGQLRAPHGVFAGDGKTTIIGPMPKLITDLFRAEGIRVLLNEGLRLDIGGEAFWLAGVDDTMVGLEDLSLALAGSRDGELKLLLAHNPVILRRAGRGRRGPGTERSYSWWPGNLAA